MPRYDYLLVGAGLFSGVFARRAAQHGKRCLVLEKRTQTGGNLFCENIAGIPVHKYGAHIFHTSNDRVWRFVNDLAEFNRFTNCPIANYNGKLYHLPFNMNTFYELWGVRTPAEAKAKIASQRLDTDDPANLEEQALKLVGKDIYEKLVKGYTEKQWGRDCRDLPAFIIRRLPVRYTFDNNYFNDKYQGIPEGGYNALINALFEGCDIVLNTDYNLNRGDWDRAADKIVYTGPLDELFDRCFGSLEYRSLRFETEILDIDNYQGVAVMNFTEREIPYTRIIEHKHFGSAGGNKTVITREYPESPGPDAEPYYPINDKKNQELYEKYRTLANKNPRLITGGRLAEYRYYDMDKTVESALALADREFGAD